MHRRLALSSIAAALALGGGDAAATTARTELTNLRFQLFDLDPGDGITPSLDLASGLQQWSAGAQVIDLVLGTTDEEERQAPGWDVPPAAVEARIDGATARASFGQLTIAVEGRTTLPDTSFGAHAGARAPNDVFGLLSAGTRLVISAAVSNFVEIDNGCNRTVIPPCSAADAWAGFSGILSGPGMRVSRSDSTGIGLLGAGFGDGSPVSRTNSETIRITLDNTSAAVAELDFEVSAGAEGMHRLPIPEPASWMMFLLGSAGLAWRTRRRRRG